MTTTFILPPKRTPRPRCNLALWLQTTDIGERIKLSSTRQHAYATAKRLGKRVALRTDDQLIVWIYFLGEAV